MDLSPLLIFAAALVVAAGSPGPGARSAVVVRMVRATAASRSEG